MTIMRNLQFVSLLLCLIVGSTSDLPAKENISGREIKDQAELFFNLNNIDAEILVSDKRTFFKCSNNLEFYPRVKNDWRTVLVKCLNTPWTVVLRTSAIAPARLTRFKTTEEDQKTKWGVVLQKNISTGEIIDESHIKISKILKNRALGSFTNLDEVIGRVLDVLLRHPAAERAPAWCDEGPGRQQEAGKDARRRGARAESVRAVAGWEGCE